jgi:hypothetical protein
VITARWTPTADDVRHAARAARRSEPFLVRHSQRIVGALMAALGLVLLLLGLPASTLLVMGLGWLAIGPFFQDRGPALNAYTSQPVEAVLDDDGLRYTGTGAVRFISTWPWTAFRYAVETPEQFVLVGHRDRRGFVPYLPKRALPDPAAARRLIAGRLEVR